MTEEGYRLTELDSGVRVVTECVPSVRSVALGFWVGVGSRDEEPAQAGLSHFLEHLLFKGTERYSAIEISELFDGLGAAMNAATSKETTQLHARFRDEHTERAFDVMSEMLLGPTYPDIDSERQVVIEEIAMYEDEPQDKVHDVLGEAVFGEHPLGRSIIGSADVISTVPIPKIADYHDRRYVGANLVVSAAGSLDHDEIVALAERHMSPPAGDVGARGGEGTSEPGARICVQEKETEQYHICLGAPGIARNDERRWALSILDAVFGGSTSSRLFREVREKRGLAYAVGSYSEQYIDTGLVALYVGTREDNVEEACQVIGAELARLTSEDVSEDELERGKEHVKGRVVLSMESTLARMSRLGKSVLLGTPLLTIDEMLAKIDAVSVPDVAELARELYSLDRLSAACIGRSEERFRSALGPVSEALAAA